MPPTLFTLVGFEIGSHFLPRPVWTAILLFVFPEVAGMTSAYFHAQLFLLIWSLVKFFVQAGLKL
jgi:hypothetical protein